jgi:hypothetical protein
LIADAIGNVFMKIFASLAFSMCVWVPDVDRRGAVEAAEERIDFCMLL